MGIGEQTVHTLRDIGDGHEDGPQIPGVIAIYSGDRPILEAERFVHGSLEIGRGSFRGALAKDDRVSRRHVRIDVRERGYAITDFGSTNGTTVDGTAIKGTVQLDSVRVVRTGRSLLVPVDNVLPFEGADVEDTERGVAGPTLRAAWSRIAVIAPKGEIIFVRGESGSGKELAARLFHALGPTASGPFIAVNCATISTAIAERILFGAKKGAYSGADADAEGLVQAAHGGTLFLDEAAELDLVVQAKLLRVLESKEVVPVGASKGRKVNVRFCVATHRDLRDEVAAGRFREDLYFRIGRPEVVLPPLRERFEEIPWHLTRTLRAVDPQLRAHATLVEECLLRAWPGNVREMTAETRVAADNARAEGADVVTRAHLGANAGVEIKRAIPASRASTPSFPPAASTTGERPRVEREATPAQLADDAMFTDALAKSNGNVSQAAVLLGIHRNRIRRWMDKKRR